jgi:Tfp pilus assembly protein FimV
MKGYRDDRDALRHENEQLEAERDDAERALAEQKARAAEAERELASQRAELAAKEAELARLTPAPAPVATADGDVVCPACGRENQQHYKFCLGCGTELGAARPVQRALAPHAAGTPNLAGAPAKSGSAVPMFVLIAVALIGGAVYILLAR